MRDLFGRENYEYYARLTGRILKVEDEWIFFTAPWVFPSLGEDSTMAEADPPSGPTIINSSNDKTTIMQSNVFIISEKYSLNPIPIYLSAISIVKIIVNTKLA